MKKRLVSLRSKKSKKTSNLNTSVSTYGKNKIRVITNEFDWLNIQEDKKKRNIFSDSDESTHSNPCQKTQRKRLRHKNTTLFHKQSKKVRCQDNDSSRCHILSTDKSNCENTSEDCIRYQQTTPPSGIDVPNSSDSAVKHKIVPCYVDLSNDTLPVNCLKERSLCLKCNFSCHSPHLRKDFDNKDGPSSSSLVELSHSIDASRKNATQKNLSEKSTNLLDQSSNTGCIASSSKVKPCAVNLLRLKIIPSQFQFSSSLFSLSHSKSSLILPTLKKSVANSCHSENDVISASCSQTKLSVLKTSNITKFRKKRKHVSFKITDGISSFSFRDDFPEANKSMHSFCNSFVHGHSDSSHTFPFLHSFDKDLDIFHGKHTVQSTPLVSNHSRGFVAQTISFPALKFDTSGDIFQCTSNSVEAFHTSNVSRNDIFDDEISGNISLMESTNKHDPKKIVTSRDRVLLECNQVEPTSFESLLYDKSKCVKLGEGLYGEVFRCFSSAQHGIALKVVPVEGDVTINGEKQKSFGEVLPEIVSSAELSSLSYGMENRTDAFIHLFSVQCVTGRYPSYFLDAWDDYSKNKLTENERPDKFPNNQMYILFEFTDGGVDLEHFQFRNAAQAISVLQQTVAGLAVAEEVYQFEHRDLHWGNILIESNNVKEIEFACCGVTRKMKTLGLTARIIDFTLSRMTKGGLCLYQDLSSDPDLFVGDSNFDYQFEVYRIMNQEVQEDWSKYRPKTNIFWIYYLLDKFLNCVKYKSKGTKIHANSFKKLKSLYKSVMQYDSCSHLLKESDLFDR